MEETSLIVKFVDSVTTRLVGEVKDLKVKTFELTYKVWFIVMDFNNQLDFYDIILGKPYMHRTYAILSKNHLSLCRDSKTFVQVGRKF